MCPLNVEAISKFISLNKQNCRYIHISILPVRDSCSIVLGRDVLFDTKYDVPILTAETSSQHDSILIYSRALSEVINTERRYESFNISDDKDNIHLGECYYLKEGELSKTALIFHYNPDMVKTYKRYIELRGE